MTASWSKSEYRESPDVRCFTVVRKEGHEFATENLVVGRNIHEYGKRKTDLETGMLIHKKNGDFYSQQN